MPHSNSSFPRSSVLVLGSNYVQSLVPSTLISQVESLLESHRIEDAVDLADQQRRKLQGTLAPDEDQQDELRYVYQRIGFQCFTETLFEDAGKNFLNGDLDPRLLISYYPPLRGSLFTPEDSLDVFSGVAERMPKDSSVDDIIRNYSPHLAPNTRSAPPTAELRKILIIAAQEMLLSFLRKHRIGSGKDPVVDTVLVKLFSQFEKTQELYELLKGENEVVLGEVEESLKGTGQYNALCILYQQRKEVDKLLDVWSRVADGEWTDDDIRDPISDIINLLNEKKDRALIQRWGVWLTKRNPERGLKLLTFRDPSKRRDTLANEDETAVLAQIEQANPAAAAQYLEHLILQKRSMSKDLHTRYATACIKQLVSYLSDSSVSKLWRAKASSYASSSTQTSSFLSYFASTTPDSEHKRVRLKTALFLQGSSLYDFSVVRDALKEAQASLKVESAIVEGKMGNHRAALDILVHDVHDPIAAEAYCLLGGEVIPSRIALGIAEKELSSTQNLYKNLWGKERKVEDKVKKDLLKVLLEVYIAQEDGPSKDRAARLLDSQAINLDVVDVIPLVPPNWPLSLMSTFLTRSFRRTLHQKHEGQIMKRIAAGQNLEVKERTWLILREEGMVVEEALEEDEEESEGGVEEKMFDEKGVLHASVDPTAPMKGTVHDLHVEEGGDGLDLR